MHILFFKAYQNDLFEEVVQVEGFTKKDGTYVKPHQTKKKKRRLEPDSNKPGQIDLFSQHKEITDSQKNTDKTNDTRAIQAGNEVEASEGENGSNVSDSEEKLDRNGLNSNGEWPMTRAEYKKIPASYKGKLSDGRKSALKLVNGGTAIVPIKFTNDKLNEQQKEKKTTKENSSKKASTKTVIFSPTHELSDGAEVVQHYENDEPEKNVWEDKNGDIIEDDEAFLIKDDNKPGSIIDVKAGIDYSVPFNEIELPDFGVQAGVTKGERKKLNQAATDLLKGQVEFSESDKTILSKYSGQGGVGDSLNEYYTRPDVSVAAWAILRNLGITDGNVMEPSSGTGVFLATAPQGIKVTGVELDKTSSKISSILHDNHENINSSLESFAITDVRQFDAVVGNCPFGLRGGLIKDDKPELTTAETYFVDTSIDKLKSGGVMAMVVPSGIIDGSNNRSFRERILRKAEFVGAHRMPTSAFDHAHTPTVTDLVIFRKRPQDVANALSVVNQEGLKDLGVWNDEFLSGGYFTGSGQENVYGKTGAGWRAKAGMGNDSTVTGSMEGVAEHISEFSGISKQKEITMQDIINHAGDDEKLKNKILNAAVKSPYEHAQLGDTKTINGVNYVLQGEPPRWHRADGKEKHESVGAADNILEDLDELFGLNRLSPDSSRVTQLREGLVGKLDKYVSTHGLPGKNKEIRNATGEDKRLWRLIGAVNNDGSYSELITGKTIDKSDFDIVALGLSGKNGNFTADELAQEWEGGDKEESLDHLFASNQYAVNADGKTWETMDSYMTGNLWEKLDEAQSAVEHEGLEGHYLDKYKKQIEVLEKEIDPKSLDEVDFQLNSAFIPVEMIAHWQNAKIVDYKEKNPSSTWLKDEFNIEFKDGIYILEGGFYERELLDKYLNRTGVRKDRLSEIDELNQQFKDWLLGSEYRDDVEELYNRNFKGFKQEQFTNDPLPVPGLDDSRGVNDYHWPIIKRALNTGKGIIAADVGLGKAQPLDAKILTPTGWVLMGDIKKGDSVIAGDGTATEVTGVFPQGEKEIFEVEFSDGAKTHCCNEHLWLTQTESDRKKERYHKRKGNQISVAGDVKQLSEIKKSLVYQTQKNHKIPLVLPVDLKEIDFIIDPYLLGVLLGDGCLSGGTVIFVPGDEEIASYVSEIIIKDFANTGLSVKEVKTKPNKAMVYSISMGNAGGVSNPVKTELRKLGIDGLTSYFKFIPEEYLFGSIEQRLSLLRGLMDTDGYVSKDGITVQFSSSSEKLADNVIYLVQSLGGIAWKSRKIPTYVYKGEKLKGSEHFTVSMRVPSNVNPFKLKRKANRVLPKTKYQPVRYFTHVKSIGMAKAQCISVEHSSHLYVTDDFIVTHNTTSGAILAKLLKVHGKAKKPAIIVPKSVIANWKKEIDAWFPGSNIMVIGENLEKGRADNKTEREQKYHQLSQNDYDFVLISQPSFNDLDLDPFVKEKYVSNDFWVQRGEALGNAGDKRRKKIRESYEQAVAQREFKTRTDVIYFNDLGIDALIVDEMQNYKNLYSVKARFGEQPMFLGGSGLSNRAFDLNLKAKWIRENNGGNNVFGLSATPTKNSPLEIYSMLSHIAPEEFEVRGIRNSEEFLDRYCKFELGNVLKTDGQIKESLITEGFKNMDELRELMFKYIDRQTADEVGLKIPKPKEHQHLVDMSEAQREAYAELRELAEDAKDSGDSTGDAHIFSIMNKMQKAAMDLELLDPERYKGEKSPKYRDAAKEIVKGSKDGGQIVFIDSIDSHNKLVDLLVEQGIDRKEIGVINAQAAKSATQRQKISDQFNAGKLKVVIGNTATMGEGVNLQKGTTDIHHLDLPWDPASMQQRNGRGVRQGNINESINIHSYLTKGSFDGYRYQTMMAKKNWMDSLWNGGDNLTNMAREGALSKDDMLVMLADDPEEARKQLDKNKALQNERIDAAGRNNAAGIYVKFIEMERSYKALKDKNSKSAVRLKIKSDQLKTRLKANKYFTAKHILDTGETALIQNETGEAWHKGRAFELAGGSDGPIYWSSEPSKWIIKGVDIRTRKITASLYESSGGESPTYNFDINKMQAQYIKPLEYNKEKEG